MSHRLYEKQLAQATRPDQSVDLARLGELVTAAYAEAEREQRRNEHSIAVMIEEVDQLNRSLQALVAARTAELAEATDALNMTLDNVDQGIVMTDSEGRTVKAHSVILSTGATANWLGLPNELRLAQTGGGVVGSTTSRRWLIRSSRPMGVSLS